MRTYDSVDNIIKDFYVYMKQDGAYKLKEFEQEFRKKFAKAEIIMKSNRKRRNKRLEAIKELERGGGVRRFLL